MSVHLCNDKPQYLKSCLTCSLGHPIHEKMALSLCDEFTLMATIMESTIRRVPEVTFRIFFRNSDKLGRIQWYRNNFGMYGGGTGSLHMASSSNEFLWGCKFTDSVSILTGRQRDFCWKLDDVSASWVRSRHLIFLHKLPYS